MSNQAEEIKDLQRRLREVKAEAHAEGEAKGIVQLATALFPALDECDTVLQQPRLTERPARRVRWLPFRRRSRPKHLDTDLALLDDLEAIRDLLVDALQDHDVTTIAPQEDERFDSREHQSLPDPEAPPGDVEPPLVVAQLLRTGYRTPERVLREALVYVKTAPAQPSASGQPADG